LCCQRKTFWGAAFNRCAQNHPNKTPTLRQRYFNATASKKDYSMSSVMVDVVTLCRGAAFRQGRIDRAGENH
jgi:hypothetical protein